MATHVVLLPLGGGGGEDGAWEEYGGGGCSGTWYLIVAKLCLDASWLSYSCRTVTVRERGWGGGEDGGGEGDENGDWEEYGGGG